ncbi:enolase C-terminal domain-like protein [Microbacterium sp. PRC9]|uniref:enolase C-terminal domain-like protein n=1 Tax=Microbacterium sp. PRC9 TaxID=2962591 RepID=UPI0028821593|nr:enolase C-terminal domain-like protein [Microbacterium sp. PRC9]MDT0144830.1 enolase C-terminal domain-like protein [Microbacterium sp. PRC9]
MIIRDLIVTPIAFRDPPLLNASGVHEPYALRTIIRLVVDGGVVGLGEGSGGAGVIRRLNALRDSLVGLSVFDLPTIERTVRRVLGDVEPELSRLEQTRVYSILDVACHDAQGKLTGRPVVDLLGGAVRDRVPYAAYLFYKWGAHPSADGTVTYDEWGPALDPEGIVRQAQLMTDRYGFRSFKLKGGVFPPAAEVDAVRALAEAFPGKPVRIDPNGAWTLETSIAAAEHLAGSLEYLEDPVLGVDAMAQVATATGMPLATNMCVVDFDQIPVAVANAAVQIILSDHHLWGGMRHTRDLSAICETFGIGMSMHSNSHLGISLAAMTHVAAASPGLTHACDTHYPWNRDDDIILPGAIDIVDGDVVVPRRPGLGVELDEEALARQHEVFLSSGIAERDDTTYMRRFEPDYDPTLPRY